MCYSTTFTYPQKVGIISLINNINYANIVNSFEERGQFAIKKVPH